MIKPYPSVGTSLSVSILLSVYNEEKVIRDRIKNISEQEYDFSALEMLIGSDASDDKTEELITELKSEYPWLKLYSFDSRRGKALVLNNLVEKSRNDILIFTDANSRFQKDAVEKLVDKFSEEKIGGVSGRLILKERNLMRQESNEERKYWEYETKIKRAEGKCGTLIGANGGIFAIRKSLYKKIPSSISITDDLFLTVSVLKMGKKFLYAADAIAYEEIAPTIKDEYLRKIRFSATNFQTLHHLGLTLKGAGFLSNFCYLSHKVLRWFIPVILLLLPILTVILYSTSIFFIVMAAAQFLFILLASLGYLFSKIHIRVSLFSVPFFFMLTNVAIFIGFINFLRGKQSGIWNPTPRDIN